MFYFVGNGKEIKSGYGPRVYIVHAFLMRVSHSLVLTRECNVNHNFVSYLGGEFIFLDYFPTVCAL